MIVVKFEGYLGNNLFQYAFCRILAEKMDLQMGYIPFNINQFNGNFTTLDTLSNYFPHAPLNIYSGKRFEEPIEVIGAPTALYQFDIDDIIKNKTNRKLIFRGYFQRMEYFEPYKDKIRQWFKIYGTPNLICNKNDVLLAIRRGTDYSKSWSLPLCYYSQAIESIKNINKIYITGTGIDEELKNYLAKYNPVYTTGSPMDCFVFIKSFNRIILSNSTYGWWAAFLSDAEEIIAPRSHRHGFFGFTGYNTGREDVDLHMRESRYKEFIINPNELDKEEIL